MPGSVRRPEMATVHRRHTGGMQPIRTELATGSGLGAARGRGREVLFIRGTRAKARLLKNRGHTVSAAQQG